MDAAAFGDRVVEERDDRVGGQDVAEELGADVFVDLVDGQRLGVGGEVVEGPAQLLADRGVGDVGRRVGDRVVVVVVVGRSALLAPSSPHAARAVTTRTARAAAGARRSDGGVRHGWCSWFR